MANMSYCRFENTASDLADCLTALREEPVDISDREWGRATAMVALAKKYLEAYEVAREERAIAEDLAAVGVEDEGVEGSADIE